MRKTSKHTEAGAAGIYSNRDTNQAGVVKCILPGGQSPGLAKGAEMQSQVRGDSSQAQVTPAGARNCCQGPAGLGPAQPSQV